MTQTRTETARLARAGGVSLKLWLTFLLVFASMALKDVLGTVGLLQVVNHNGLLGGVFDGLADIAAVLSVGIEGVVTVKNGFTLPTFIGFGALFFGSLIGTYLGVLIKWA